MTLFEVRGIVTAPDGTAYRPIYFGSFWSACSVYDAILEGATERDETVTVKILNGAGVRVAWARWRGSWDTGGEGVTRAGSVVNGAPSGR